jgi:hypothetical protein
MDQVRQLYVSTVYFTVVLAATLDNIQHLLTEYGPFSLYGLYLVLNITGFLIGWSYAFYKLIWAIDLHQYFRDAYPYQKLPSAWYLQQYSEAKTRKVLSLMRSDDEARVGCYEMFKAHYRLFDSYD